MLSLIRHKWCWLKHQAQNNTNEFCRVDINLVICGFGPTKNSSLGSNYVVLQNVSMFFLHMSLFHLSRWHALECSDFSCHSFLNYVFMFCIALRISLFITLWNFWLLSKNIVFFSTQILWYCLQFLTGSYFLHYYGLARKRLPNGPQSTNHVKQSLKLGSIINRLETEK